MKRGPAALAGLVVLAMLLRVGAIVATRAWAAPPEENRLIARNLRAGRGFTFTQFGVTGPTAIRGPVYPMFLAVLGPGRMKLILAVNVLAGGASVVAAYALMTRLSSPPPLAGGGGGRGSADVEDISTADNPSPYPLPQGEGGKAAWLAATFIAIWPTQVFAATVTQGLSLAVVLLLAALAVAAGRTPLCMIVGGLLGGMAGLTEPVLALPVLLAGAMISGPLSRYAGGGLGRGSAEVQEPIDSAKTLSLTLSRGCTGEGTRAALIALFVAAALIPVVPWLYRNAIVFGRVIPITSNFWPDAFLGNGPAANGERYDNLAALLAATNPAVKKSTRIDRLPPAQYDALKRSEPQRVAVFRQWTTNWIGDNPVSYVRLCLQRAFATTYSVRSHALAGNLIFVASRAVGGAWLLAWLLAPRHSRAKLRVAVALILGMCLTTAFSLAEARNSVLIDVPQLLVWAVAIGDARMAKAAA